MLEARIRELTDSVGRMKSLEVGLVQLAEDLRVLVGAVSRQPTTQTVRMVAARQLEPMAGMCARKSPETTAHGTIGSVEMNQPTGGAAVLAELATRSPTIAVIGMEGRWEDRIGHHSRQATQHHRRPRCLPQPPGC